MKLADNERSEVFSEFQIPLRFASGIVPLTLQTSSRCRDSFSASVTKKMPRVTEHFSFELTLINGNIIVAEHLLRLVPYFPARYRNVFSAPHKES